ncbi:hypothetical protein pipiens_019788, partial [Culex pipiens pipiens]
MFQMSSNYEELNVIGT